MLPVMSGTPLQLCLPGYCAVLGHVKLEVSCLFGVFVCFFSFGMLERLAIERLKKIFNPACFNECILSE